MKKYYLIGLALVLATSCASNTMKPTMEQLNTADYGPFPTNYEELIKEVMNPHLLDPYSAIYIFTKPVKSWNNMGDELIYGWCVSGTINAKNKMGGYVGAKPFYAMIKDDEVVRFMTDGFVIPDTFILGIRSAATEKHFKGNPNAYKDWCNCIH